MIPHLMFAHILADYTLQSNWLVTRKVKSWTGAAVIAVTCFYDVTLWANWLNLIPHMNRWRTFSYAERLAMLALATAGLWLLAPLCALPRLFESYRQQRPIWRQRRGLLEMVGASC
jgi:hypothetical protein